MHVVVLGSGSWGTALAILLARNDHEVTLVGRNPSEIAELEARRENLRYLPGFVIPSQIRFETFAARPNAADLTILAVPSGAVRGVVQTVFQSGCAPEALILSAAKGLESTTGLTVTEVVGEVAPGARAGVLSGPNLAVEMARGIPAAAVVAFHNPATAEAARSALMCRSFRVYVSQDVVGVQLAGALKNVLAIGAGLSDGLGFGDNTKAALIARGLHEMTCLGLAMGARVDTFMGVAGVGDLFATAASSLSRNYRIGKALGQGRSLAEALQSIDQVAEGVPTSEAAMALSRKHGVPMPIFEATDAVIHARLDPRRAVDLLMERTPRVEGFPAPHGAG